MPDNDSPNYDPQNFMTPGQIQANREYAQMLLKQGSGGAPTNVSNGITFASPWGIASSALNGYVGRQGLNEAAAGERANINAGTQAPGLPTPPNAPQGAGMLQGTGAPGGYAAATSAQESGGNYAALGPVTPKGDRAYGKYQVMGANIPQWTQEVLGRPMTPEQFLANPQAQDAVYQRKFSEYTQKYGSPEAAARAWFAGEGNMNNLNAKDQLGTTVGQYGQNFTRLASNAPGLPQGATPQPIGSPQAMSAALGGTPAASTGGGGGEQVAQATAARGPTGGALPPPPSSGLPGQVPIQPGQQGNQPIVAPSMVPQRQQMSQQQLQNIMHAAAVNPNNLGLQYAAQQALQSYQSQFQPQSLETATGTVIVDSQGRQQFIGKIITQNYKGPEGIDIPVQMQYQADGSLKVITPNAQGGGATPLMPRAPASQAPPQPQPQPQVPTQPPQSVPGRSGAAEAPTKLASLETGTMNDASPAASQTAGIPSPGMLGTPPPSEAAATPGATPVPQAPTGVKTAQSVIPQVATDAMNQMADFGVNYKARNAMVGEVGKQAAEFLNTTRQKAIDAQTDKQNLDLLGNIMDSPNYQPGMFGGINLFKNRLEAAIAQNFPEFAAQAGLDPHKATAMEVAEKLTNDLNLGSLRQKLGGLGQVRVFEGQMVKGAFANMDNSIAANKAVLELAQSVNQRIRDAQEYASTLPHDDINIQDKVYSHFKDIPIMPKEREEYWNQQIKADLAAQKAAPKAATPAAPGAFPLPGFTPKAAPQPAPNEAPG